MWRLRKSLIIWLWVKERKNDLWWWRRRRFSSPFPQSITLRITAGLIAVPIPFLNVVSSVTPWSPGEILHGLWRTLRAKLNSSCGSRNRNYFDTVLNVWTPVPALALPIRAKFGVRAHVHSFMQISQESVHHVACEDEKFSDGVI